MLMLRDRLGVRGSKPAALGLQLEGRGVHQRLSWTLVGRVQVIKMTCI
jgi:hypothetical protein